MPSDHHPDNLTLPLWPGRDPASDHGQIPTLTLLPCRNSPDVADHAQPASSDSGSAPTAGTAPHSAGPIVLVLPGGGYNHLAGHEAEPVADAFNQQGFHAAVLRYRVHPCRHPDPIHDAQRAVRLIRRHAADWNINPGAVAVLGFSAGGHLAATLANHHNKFPNAQDPLSADVSARPDASILCYAVLDAHRYPHQGSFRNLLGDAPDPNLLSLMSMPEQVSADTPPTFLWHTANDAAVPVGGALRYAQALSDQQIPFELHVYPDGRHGLGLALSQPEIAGWVNLAARFLASAFEAGR